MYDSEQAPLIQTSDDATVTQTSLNHETLSAARPGSGNGILVDPLCVGMEELPNALKERARISELLSIRNQSGSSRGPFPEETDPLFIHIAHGLACTTGSALGSTPPSLEACFAAYQVPNKAGLTAGSRAWSKHSHRSRPSPADETETNLESRKRSAGWWGIPSGPVAVINEKSTAIFWKIIHGATWRNLHWLPHEVLVYEVRVTEGYGMRWAQDQSGGDTVTVLAERPWIFRGFLEPQMENGHELGWIHPLSS